MKKLLSLLVCAALSQQALAQPFSAYIEEVHRNSFSVKVAKKTIEAEEHRHQARESYYLPTFKVSNTLKSEIKETVETREKEIKGSLNSRLLSSTTHNSIAESNAKLANAINTLNIERENLSSAVLKNVINIEQYLALQAFAVELNDEAKRLEKQIERQYRLGTASENDINRTSLLVSRIDNEINLIDKQVKLSISNIEAVTSMRFPETGVNLDESMKARIEGYVGNEDDLTNNLTYLGLGLQRDIATHLAEQQDPFFTVDFSLEHSFVDAKEWQNETVVMLSANVNIFDYNKTKETAAQLAGIDSALLKMDMKLHELRNNLQTFNLYENSFREEKANLEFQIAQTQKLIDGQASEYAVGKVSLYEMLNTRLDLFNAKKQRADVEVQYLQNKIDMMQNAGQLL